MSFLADTNLWSNVPVGEHLFLFSPMIVLVCTMLAVVAFPIVLGRSAAVTATIVKLGVITAFILAIRVAGQVTDGGVSGLSTSPLAGLLIADNLAAGFQIILLVFLGAVTLLWLIGSASSEENSPEFFILLLGSALGMLCMTATSNLLMIVLAIELASLPSYAIVGFNKRDRLGAEASLKYMIFGAVCAAIMLYGVSLIYGLVGSLRFEDVAEYTVSQMVSGQNRLLLSVALLCFFAGVGFKISAVPFHFWCPDAFEGAKIEVTTWLSVASKAAGLILLARLVVILCSAVDYPIEMSLVQPIAWGLGIIAAVTCTVGNFSAYMQKSVKRMLAYSSIAHAGYMMMATAVFLHPSTKGYEAGLTALFVYIVIYLVMNLGAFGVTALVSWETGSDKIEAFVGLMRRGPWLAVPMVICLVSLVGLPPLAGFMGKWWILVALGKLESNLGWFLVIVAVVNTLISLYYYLRVIVAMILKDDGQPVIHASLGGVAMVNICGIVVLALFFLQGSLKTTSERFTRDLYQAATNQDDSHRLAWKDL